MLGIWKLWCSSLYIVANFVNYDQWEKTKNKEWRTKDIGAENKEQRIKGSRVVGRQECGLCNACVSVQNFMRNSAHLAQTESFVKEI